MCHMSSSSVEFSQFKYIAVFFVGQSADSARLVFATNTDA